jgi:replicative DNA helicase
MNNDEIEKLLKDLDKEIKETESDIYKEEQMIRLAEMAKQYTGEDEVISFKDLEQELKNAPPVKKLPSKIEGLDSFLHGGFMTQTVTTIAATPKSGKTSFCMYLTTQMSELKPLWFALEESSKSLIRKMIKNGLEVPLGYTPKKNSTVTLGWIEQKIIESYAKYGTKLVFIDQLDFIVEQDNRGDRHDLKIAQTMRTLHQLAVKLDVAIFLICHLEKMEPEQKPTTKNLRGSSSIWGEADNCLFLWRECKKESGELVYSNNILLSLQANREDGDTGNIKMIFDNGRFIESEWDSEEERAKRELEQF